MKLEFWNERWKMNQIGFHQLQENQYLLDHWKEIASDNSTVFVPLCGKSRDLIWLMKQGHNVIGVECSQLAVESFFSENNLDYEIHTEGVFSIYRSTKISIFLGDFFDIQSHNLADVRYVYDRASLVALPDDMRLNYVNKLSQLTQSGCSVLLVTLEYDQHLMSGPPFSISSHELNRLYSDAFNISEIYRHDIIQSDNHFRNKGLDALYESCFCLTKL